jgi:hypothetical protein
VIILIGNGPDFVMRQGLVDVFHRAVVRVENDVGVEIFHETTSDRSLWLVAKVVSGYMRANDVVKDDVKTLDFNNLQTVIEKRFCKVLVSILLPPQMEVETRDMLAREFAIFINQFL